MHSIAQQSLFALIDLPKNHNRREKDIKYNFLKFISTIKVGTFFLKYFWSYKLDINIRICKLSIALTSFQPSPISIESIIRQFYKTWAIVYENLKRLLFGLWLLNRVLFCFEHWIIDEVQILNDSKIF